MRSYSQSFCNVTKILCYCIGSNISTINWYYCKCELLLATAYLDRQIRYNTPQNRYKKLPMILVYNTSRLRNVLLLLPPMVLLKQILHYNDVIKSMMASRIIGVSIVYLTGCLCVHREWLHMMTLSIGNIFRVTRPLWEEFTGDRWIPITDGQHCVKCFHLMTSSWPTV